MKRLQTIFSAILAIGALSSAAAQDVGTLSVIRDYYPQDQATDVVFVAEGYTIVEMNKFFQDAESFTRSFLDDPAVAAYANHFNFHALFVASNESGADADNIQNDADCKNGTARTVRDTRWNVTYCYNNIKRLIYTSWTADVQRFARTYVPGADVFILIVNSDNYGGGGGAIAVVNRTNASSAIHETGHSFVGLADEYETAYDGYNTKISINTTSNDTRETVHWNYWIEPDTPVPTPETSQYADAIGVFEGAGYRPTGWYRPKQDCKMKTLNAKFCSVCAEAWVLRLYKNGSPLLGAVPASGSDLFVQGPNSAELAVSLKTPSDGSRTVRVQWEVDGTVMPGLRDSAVSLRLPDGEHVVRALVRDTTELVRRDTLGYLSDTAVWRVVVDDPSGLNRPLDLAAPAGELRIGELSRNGVRLVLPQSGLHRVELFSADGRRIGDLGWHDFSAGEQWLRWPAGGIAAGSVLVRVTRDSDLATAEKRAVVR